MLKYEVRRALLGIAVVASLTSVPAGSSADWERTWSLTIRLSSSPSGFERFEDRPPVGVQSKGDFYRAGSILRNTVPQFGKPKGARVGSDDFLVKTLSSSKSFVRGRTRLPGGLIRIDTVIPLGQSMRFVPVAGGTGDFAGARGTLETIELAGVQRALNIYRLRLP